MDEQSTSETDESGRPLNYATPRGSSQGGRWLPPGFWGRTWGRTKTVGRWSGRVALAGVILCVLALGFGTPGADAERLRGFAAAVERWQHNPDFRAVQVEYVEMGSAAMRTRVCFVDSTSGIMNLRSLPGLPEHLRVNDTSFAHYTNFTAGPLSAYMHLTAEQGLSETLKMLQYLGNKPDLSDEDVRGFLRGYKLHYPVASDTGAVESVKRLINDVDAGRAFEVSEGVAERMKPHIATVAVALGQPGDVRQMTPPAQLEVWRRLDDHVLKADYELWRTKQVNDWLNGVWAQVYGTMYSGLITPTLRVREVSRVLGPMLVLAWVAVAVWKRRRAGELATAGAAGAVGQPRLALEGGGELSER
jgi:hypothetical protein